MATKQIFVNLPVKNLKKSVEYGHGFQDLDGHIWELAFMEQSAIKKQA